MGQRNEVQKKNNRYSATFKVVNTYSEVSTGYDKNEQFFRNELLEVTVSARTFEGLRRKIDQILTTESSDHEDD